MVLGKEASVIEKLLTKKRNPDVFISFFFVRFDDRQSSKAEVILKSIIRQMLNVSNIFAKVETLLDNMQLNLASGLNDIEKLLQSIASEFKTLYIVIDGLDECTQSERHDLLESLHSVMKVRSNIKLFLAGRDSVSREVQIKFPTLKQILMDCSSAQSDIATYVEGIVQEKLKTEELIVSDPDLIEDIKAALSGGANGMFLWVVFQVNELCLQHCDEDIRTAIRNFPKDLEETFNRAIDRIVSWRNEDIAKRIFRLVVAAKEPLSLNQLEEVIFVEIGQEFSRTERRSNGIAHISSWCENLVHVDEELKTVQFVHQTVQQFFIERSSKSRHNQFYLNLEDADHYLGEICVTYLNFNDFKTTLARRQQPLPPMPPIAIAGTALGSKWKAFPSIPTLLKLNLNTKGGSTASNAIEALGSFQRDDTVGAKEGLLVGRPFLGYASIHWISHTTVFQEGKSSTWNLWEKMIVQGHDLIKKPWMDKPFNESIRTILDWSQKFHHYALIRLILLTGMLSDSDRGQLMQRAAIHEDITLLDILLEHEKPGIIIDQGCELAVQLGHLNALDRLLAAGADGQTALQAAVQSGDRKIITHILITGVDGRSLLHGALADNDLTTARALVDAGVDGQPLLQAAIEKRDQDITKLLLAAGVDSQSALQTAAKRGRREIIKFLLAAGADGRTALLNAANNDHLDTIKALLAAGVNGQTALQAAVQSGDRKIITRMLTTGVDGWPLLQSALADKDLTTARALLNAGVDAQPLLQAAVERHDSTTAKTLIAAGVDGQLLLQAAVERHDSTAVKTLIAAGADGLPLLQAAMIKNDPTITRILSDAGIDGWSVLQAAITTNDLTTVRTLLKSGLDGRPFLRVAIEHRDLAMTWSLLDAGVDSRPLLQAAVAWHDQDLIKFLSAAGIGDQPALLAVSKSVNQDLMKLLLAAGFKGGSALQAASQWGYSDMVEILLALWHRVDVGSTWYIESALDAASRWGHLDIVEKLLDAGASIGNRHIRYDHALQIASKGGHLQIIQRLLAAGAEVDESGSFGSALQAASESGHIDVVETLLAAGPVTDTTLRRSTMSRHMRTVSRLKQAGSKR
ncbi:Ankyrin repeat domain-containing protein 50 [Trichoderma lentiforme]|uniref:Ankyrin repeat domain-containing protein 50 n=1 Tax=Trichoderma lentiforme TaxID=1567552 RepID=A0A9P4X455_9HYPO|nr:Ankyrin repeat domain-containing protein 50 [Trichoderma lentiforme]